MEIQKIESIIEAILFAAGREVNIKELIMTLEMNKEEIENIILSMQEEYKNENRGIEIIKIEDNYQLCTKKDLYDYVYPILDNRAKPSLSNAALETLAIIAYNPKITRAEIESIRGVSADACIYKLLEFGLIQEAATSEQFLKMFGYTSLNDLPELPRYKLDENQQIVIDDLIEQKENEEEQKNQENIETEAIQDKKEDLKNEEEKIIKRENNEEDVIE